MDLPSDDTFSFHSDCAGCSARDPETICGGCGVLRLCSRACQQRLWAAHKASCRAAAAALAAPPAEAAPPEIDFTFRKSGEDEIPIPEGVTLVAVRARVAGLEVAKLTGGIIDCRKISRAGSDPFTACCVFGASDEAELAAVSRRLFTWGSCDPRPLGAEWGAPTAPSGKEVVLVVNMLRVPVRWRRRGIARAVFQRLLAHPRTKAVTLCALAEGSMHEDTRGDSLATSNAMAVAALFFGAVGFRPAGPHVDLLLRPADAEHAARRRAPETLGNVRARLAAREEANAARAAEVDRAKAGGLSGAAARRRVAEFVHSDSLQRGGELAAAAQAADEASLRRAWPRAVAAALQRGMPLLHLLNVVPGRYGMRGSSEEALNPQRVMYDVFGELDVEQAAALGVPPALQHRRHDGGCAVV
jgi:hypothetical protein